MKTWLHTFCYQYRSYKRWGFGFFGRLKYAIWWANKLSKQARTISADGGKGEG